MKSELVLKMEIENARMLSFDSNLTLEQGTKAFINYFELFHELNLPKYAQTEEK